MEKVRAPGAESGATVGNVQLVGLIAFGGLGMVYEGRDPTGTPVAVKLARVDVAGATESLVRDVSFLKHIDHPGVVRVLTDATQYAVPHYVMELIGGQPLAALLATRARCLEEPGRDTPTLKSLLSVIRKLCGTLADLHGRGIVHRDLSPANVMVRADGTPILIDFGLGGRFATVSGRDALEVGGSTLGTVAYAAPEQIRGEVVDPRADLYSVGCMLFHALTGQLPFMATSARAMAAHHVASPVAFPPSADHIPDALKALVRRLMAKRPPDRPGYAGLVAAELSAVCDDAAPDVWTPYLHRAPMVGRSDRLSHAAGLLARCAEGKGGRAFFAGDSGIGKTRLLSEVATEASHHAFAVIAVECAAIGGADASVHHASLLEIFRPVLRHIANRCRSDPAATQRILGDRGRMLVEFEPTLAELPGQEPHPEPWSECGRDATERLFPCLSATLAALAKEEPTVLIVDDLQWADDLSLRFLGSLQDDFFATTPLVIVGALRNEVAHRSLATFVKAQGPHCNPLPPLAPADMREMAVQMLGMPIIPDTLQAALVRQAGGNPFFLTEYLRTALGENWLFLDGGGAWHFTGVGRATIEQDGGLAASSSVQQLIAGRLGRLTGPAREILRVCAVMGRSVPTEFLCHALRLPPPSIYATLQELTLRSILELVSPKELRFIHDGIRERAYALVQSDDLPGLHETCARTIEALHATAPHFASMAPELGHHWARAGAVSRAVTYWERGGQHALAAASYFDAVRYFQLALSSVAALQEAGESVSDDRRGHWETLLGEAHYHLGNIAESDNHLVRGLAHYGYRPARSRAHRLVRCGLRAVVELVRCVVPRQATSGDAHKGSTSREQGITTAASRIGVLRIWNGDSLGTIEHVLLAASLGGTGRGMIEAARPLAHLGFLSGLAHLSRLSAHYFTRARRVADAAEHRRLSAEIDYTEALIKLGRGDWEEAEALARRSLAALPAAADLQDAESALNVLGHLACMRDRLEEATACAERVATSARARKHVEHEIWGINLKAICLARGGNSVGAIPELERALELLAERPNLVSEVHALASLSHAQLDAGRAAEALAIAERALALLAAHRGPAMMVTLVPCVGTLVDVLLTLAERTSAVEVERRRSLLQSAQPCVARLARLRLVFPVAAPWHKIAVGRLRALRQRRGAARRALNGAAQAARTLQVPFEQRIAEFHLARLAE